MHPERWTFDWFYNREKTMNVYDALLRDGREKRAAAEVRPVSVDSVPTTAQVWRVLRGLYGEKLIGMTVVAVIDGDKGVTIQTVTTDANPRAGA